MQNTGGNACAEEVGAMKRFAMRMSKGSGHLCA